MRTVSTIAIAMSLFTSLVPGALAQWPLGKELTQIPQKGEHGVAVTITGRFQIFVSPNQKGQTFMLDTDTGRVWIIVKDHTSGDLSLRRVPVEEVDAKLPPVSGSGATKQEEKKSSETK
jgi:hypothetical protein